VAIANLNLAESQESRTIARAALLPNASESLVRGSLAATLGSTIPGLPTHYGPFWETQAARQRDRCHRFGHHKRARAVPVAGQHPRIAERDRAGGDPDQRAASQQTAAPAVPPANGNGTHARSSRNIRETLEGAERQQILAALEKANWLVAGPEGAAARLGMKRSTLQSRMQKLGIRVGRTLS
jgi:hypothetical protein